MARYAEWNKFVQNLKTDKYGATNVNEIGIAFEKATADVVPKSEVERLQAEAENLRNANTDLALALLYECEPTKEHLSELEKAVREKVAREIFADIDGKISCFFPSSSFVNAPNTTHYQLLAMLAELKKKYTEEQV